MKRKILNKYLLFLIFFFNSCNIKAYISETIILENQNSGQYCLDLDLKNYSKILFFLNKIKSKNNFIENIFIFFEKFCQKVKKINGISELKFIFDPKLLCFSVNLKFENLNSINQVLNQVFYIKESLVRRGNIFLKKKPDFESILKKNLKESHKFFLNNFYYQMTIITNKSKSTDEIKFKQALIDKNNSDSIIFF